MKLARISFLAIVVCVAVVAVLGRGSVSGSLTAPHAMAPHPPLSGGAASVDELLGRFVAAIEAKDVAALEALRVDETEYRKIIMPGSVKPGQPPQKLSAAADQYFWESLDTKSKYGGRALIAGYGGRKYRVTDVTWKKGVGEWAWFRCYDRLQLTMVDEDGAEHVLESGSVADVDGRFKFISFIRD
ncbi:hypothetical protein K2Z84_27480 [Candidatus Binatia bacterium]|jgi:hypothetical protein|nr:hypothetical protein [Candidatus Binatia bacterium]